MYKKKQRIAKGLIFVAVLMMFGSLYAKGECASVRDSESVRGIRDFDGIIPFNGDSIPAGSASYLLFEEHGGRWCDAEKTVEDLDDEVMCWAAAASNVLEWTGWGLVPGIDNSDDVFQYIQDYWKDVGGMEYMAWHWWFDGTGPADKIEVSGGGNFYPSLTWSDYYHETWWDSGDTMKAIEDYTQMGWGMTLGFHTHAITCWGLEYDPNVDKVTNPEGYYLGVWVTDSDDDKTNSPNYPDSLRYYNVDYDHVNGRWILPTYSGWYIESIFAFEPYRDATNANRPDANADGPYNGYEGSPITFDGSSSTDADLNALQYRWDLDSDRTWDTGWSTSPTTSFTWSDDYGGTVVLEVSDGKLRDVHMVSVTVNNVAPSVNAGPDQVVDEGDTVNFSGAYTDPGTGDTHSIEWDFDGSTSSGTLTPTHVYGDNGVYTVTLRVTDDDGGVGTNTLKVTVNNVAPSITELVMTSPNADNPEFILPTVNTPYFAASTTDMGSDDLTFTWNWGDGTGVTIIYYNDNTGPDPYPSPEGTYPFSRTDQRGHIYSAPGTYTVTLTVEDDDGGVDIVTYEIKVLSAEEAKDMIRDYILGLLDGAFKGNPDQRKNAFNNMFSAIDDKLANEEYEEVIMDLQHNVREKADGSVDGSSKNDWIKDATAQENICWKIDALIAYLQTLI